MFRRIILLFILVLSELFSFTQVLLYSPAPVFPRTEYCIDKCFEIYDTVIDGNLFDTTRFKRHLIVIMREPIPYNNPYLGSDFIDTIQVPMRNLRFNYCFSDTGNYWLLNWFTSIDNNGNEVCCSGIVYPYAIVIKNCPPVANFMISMDTICERECLEIQDSSIQQTSYWSWIFPGSTTSGFYGKSPPNVCYHKSGTYPIQLIATNSFGSDTLTKEVIVTKCYDCISAPNAFSPNGDGVNDTFKVYSNCILEYYNMQIYNRWGTLVFESYDIRESWDGQNKNALCSADSYAFIINYRIKNSTKYQYRKGTILLIK